MTAETQTKAGKPVFWADYSAKDNWVVCGDIRLDLPTHHCFVRPICQKLVEAGHPDGELRFRDPSMTHPWNFSIASIHRTAAGPVRQTREEHFQKVKEQAARRAERRAAEPPAAPKVTIRHFASVPPDDKFVFVEVAGQRIRVNPMHRKAFNVILDTPEKWEVDIHGKTRGYVLEMGWVVVKNGTPALTELGEEIWLAAEAAIETYRKDYEQNR
jgi:hypothetical protein